MLRLTSVVHDGGRVPEERRAQQRWHGARHPERGYHHGVCVGVAHVVVVDGRHCVVRYNLHRHNTLEMTKPLLLYGSMVLL